MITKHCQQSGSYFKGKFSNDISVLQCSVLPNVSLADTLLFYLLLLFLSYGPLSFSPRLLEYHFHIFLTLLS